MGRKIFSIYHCEVVLPGGMMNKLVETFLNTSNFISLALSDRIITYTKDFHKSSKLLNNFESKVTYVYPPVNKPKIDKRITKVIGEKIRTKNSFVIGIAARLAAEKGIEYLFEALPQIMENGKWKMENGEKKKIKIIVAGSKDPVGEENYKRKIMKLVDKYKDNVIFLGELSQEEMGSFYSLIDVLVLPSTNSTESFGMVQVEAMMMGVPVVASDLPGVRVPILKTGMG
ncbi:MAG: glycosyltransferase family 4 protein, partial [Nitrososphaeraceae archaeon]|nr:glycosyltransferase family 4 protein [Nitrososphaeraceae archaeon]